MNQKKFVLDDAVAENELKRLADEIIGLFLPICRRGGNREKLYNSAKNRENNQEKNLELCQLVGQKIDAVLSANALFDLYYFVFLGLSSHDWHDVLKEKIKHQVRRQLQIFRKKREEEERQKQPSQEDKESQKDKEQRQELRFPQKS